MKWGRGTGVAGGGGGSGRGPIVTFKLARRLRRDMSLPEIVLWRALRGKRLSLRFRKQHPVGPYELDFYCPDAQLAFEVDGCVHNLPEQTAHDERGDAWLANQGIRVLRLAAADVLNDRELEGVPSRINVVGKGEA